MKLKTGSKTPVAIRIRSLDAKTVWAAHQLQLALGWQPLLNSVAGTVPKWLDWGEATGSEPLLDLTNKVT